MSALDTTCLNQYQGETISWNAPHASPGDREAAYKSVAKILDAHQYLLLDRRQKGIVRAFLLETTGYSRAQVTRLIGQWAAFRRLVVNKPARRGFPTRYTTSDIALLAELDVAHEDLAGPAVKHILAREYHLFGKAEYERLADLSVSHIYNLRRAAQYRELRAQREASQTPRIGQMFKSELQREPGYLCIQFVRGCSEKDLSIYQICAIDRATKWQVVGCAESLLELHLSPVLEAILHQFPFQICRLRCELRTANQGSPAPLVTMGANVDSLQRFLTAHLNPYVNYHRPCAFAAASDGSFQQTTCYLTPYERLVSLPGWQTYLKTGITPILLRCLSARMSDTESARQLKRAKVLLQAGRDLKPLVFSKAPASGVSNMNCY